VSVTIGTRSFGPVLADDAGLAQVPVDVPPGVSFAYQGERPLDLRVPPAPHVFVEARPAELRADVEEVVAVRAYVITGDGAPRAGAPVRFDVSEGTLAGVEEVEPGVTVARWILPPGRAGSGAVRAAVEGDPGPPASAAVVRRPGPPARVDAAPDRALAVAGEAPVQLDVRVLDAAGNPTAAPLRVEPAGPVLLVREAGPGEWTVGLDVPERLEGRAAVDVRLDAAGAARPVRVPLAAAAPATVTVAVGAREVVADGQAALELRVEQRDRFGNPAVEPPPAAATAMGSELTTGRDGDAFRVVVRPRRRLAPAEEAVTITAAGRTERLAVALRAADARATLSGRVGYLASAGGLRSAFAGVEAALWPERRRRLGLAVEAGAFSFDRTDDVLAAGAAAQLKGVVRYLPVAAIARWRAAPSERTVLQAGAGAVVAPLAASLRLGDQPEVRETGVAAGALASFGAGARLGRGQAFLEARLLWLADPGLEIVRGRLVATGLVAGWSHGF
jgi:hypothetical protein